jgi:hypothetical protein
MKLKLERNAISSVNKDTIEFFEDHLGAKATKHHYENILYLQQKGFGGLTGYGSKISYVTLSRFTPYLYPNSECEIALFQNYAVWGWVHVHIALETPRHPELGYLVRPKDPTMGKASDVVKEINRLLAKETANSLWAKVKKEELMLAKEKVADLEKALESA